MRDEAASIELLSVDGYYEIESANETLRYMLQLLIMKGNVRLGRHTKIQSMLDTNSRNDMASSTTWI